MLFIPVNKRKPLLCFHVVIIIPPTQQSCWRGILVSLRPSVCPSHTPCPLCSAASFGWIHFIFTHLMSINFRECVACEVSYKILKFEFLAIFFLICNFNFVLFWLRIWCESLVWVIMGRWGVSKNPGVLVVLVLINSSNLFTDIRVASLLF